MRYFRGTIRDGFFFFDTAMVDPPYFSGPEKREE